MPRKYQHFGISTSNKSPQFRLIKRTSRAIYNLQSLFLFVLSSYERCFCFLAGFRRYVFADLQTAHRINNVLLLLELFSSANSFCAYEIWEFFEFLNQSDGVGRGDCQIERKLTWS
jgi:hypothetical protein